MSTDTDAGGAAPKPRRPRWLWIAFTLSLALNLLLVGLLAGGWWMRGGHAKRHHVFTGAIERLMQDLPPAKQETAQAVLEEYHASAEPRRKKVLAARRAAKAAVLAETYDEAKLAEEMAELRELRTEEHAALHNMFLGLLKELTLEERKKLLDYIRAGFKNRWRGSKPKPESSSSQQ